MIALREICPGLFLTLSVFSLALCSSAFADLPPESGEWSLERDSEGVRIYNQELSTSDFDAFKAETVLDAPLVNVMAVMANPASCVEWVHGCTHSEGLNPEGQESVNFNDRYAYSINDLPWPAQDRDYVLHIQTRTNTETGEIIMALSAVPDKRKEDSGMVRVEHSDTLYTFSETDDGSTRMTWVQHTDPNGALPSWLVNSLAIDIPFNSLQKLEEVANEPRYQNHELVYDEKGRLIGVRAKDSPTKTSGSPGPQE